MFIDVYLAQDNVYVYKCHFSLFLASFQVTSVAPFKSLLERLR